MTVRNIAAPIQEPMYLDSPANTKMHPAWVAYFVQLTGNAADRTGINADKLDGIDTPASVVSGLLKHFESLEQTITINSTTTIAHGFGVKPKLGQAMIICKTAELGFSVGDEVQFIDTTGTGLVSLGVSWDTTNIYYTTGPNLTVIRRDTQNRAAITSTNWKLILRAWA